MSSASDNERDKNDLDESDVNIDLGNQGISSKIISQNLDNFGRQKIISSDIIDPYLRAAFEGDTESVVQQQYKLQKALDQDKQAEDLWNKSLLGFFLAIQNSQIKTANTFYKKYKLLRIIVWKLICVYDQSVSPKKSMAQNQYSYKTKRKEELEAMEQSSSSIDQMSTKKKVSSTDGQRSEGKNNKQPSFNLNPVIDFESENEESDDNHNESHKIKHKSYRKQNKVKKGDEDFDKINKKSKKSDQMKSIKKKEPAPKTYFKSINEVNKMKAILRSEFAISFNTNLLKISLNFGEDRIAALIVARFPVQLEEAIIKYAVQQKSMIFIHNVFFYNKNYVIPERTVVNTESQEEQEPELLDEKLSIFQVDDLVKMIHNLFDFHDAEKILCQVIGWKFKTEGNILKLLCDVGHERVAAKFKNNYYQFSDWNFFFDCVMSEKQYFLKHALTDQYFDNDYMHNEILTNWLMDRLKIGKNLLYPLNLLLFTDFRKWNLNQLSDFAKVAKLVVTPNLETNYMLITYNPIMTLGLMVQYLKAIKLHFNKFDTECTTIIRRLEILGKIILEKMQFDHVEQIFMEKDFTDRTVLNIITDNKIMTFIVINKLKFLLDKIWEGKDSQLIDGKTSHFSRTKFLLYHEIKQLKGVKITINDIIGDTFKPNIEDYNFIFQKKFRQESIQIIFILDFLSASLIACAFQYLNYYYLILFTERRYKDAATYEEKYSIIEKNLQTYKQISFLGTLLSISFFICFFGRFVYNTFSRRKIKSDIWMLFDISCGCVNIFAFNLISNATTQQMLDPNQKRFYDYAMIVLLIMSWLRFFSYFLVISMISKLTITMFNMLKETISFMIILLCYLILMTTIFATLFRDVQSDDAEPYKELTTTFRELIDYFLANYTTKDMKNYNTSHSVLYMTHVLISNIFLMNYLVAILTTVYEIMIKNGDFYAIEYQYTFITKYLKALDENNGYEIFVLIPPPLNFLSSIFIIFAPSKEQMKKFSKYFKNFYFWTENIFLILGFLGYLIMHNPLILLKTSYQITKMDGKLNKIMYLTVWIIFGLFFLLYINIVDTCMLMNILCLDNSVLFDQGEEEKVKLERHKFQIYKDIIRSFQQLHKVAETSKNLYNQRQNMRRLFTSKLSITNKLKLNKDEIELRLDDIYVIRKEMVIAAYMQISNGNSYTKAYRQQHALFAKRKSNNQMHSSIDFSVLSARDQIQQNEPELSDQFRMQIGKMMISNNKDDIEDLIEFMNKDKKENNYLNITEDEGKILHSFIGRYTIAQKNQEESSVNLDLVIKTFPNTFTPQHIYKLDLLHFQRMQKSLITFFNDDQDEMFNYYDNRMKRRLNSLKRNGSKNSYAIGKILDLTKYVLDYIQWDEAVNKLRTEAIKKLSTHHGTDTLRTFKTGARPSVATILSNAIQVSDFDENEQHEVEGMDILQREQQKNFMKMLSFKNKSIKNQSQNKVDKQISKQLSNVQNMQYFTVPNLDHLKLPSADQILQQIRQKREEKKMDRIDDNSYEDKSFSENEGSYRKNEKVLSARDAKDVRKIMKQKTLSNNIAREVDDSFGSDKSLE